MLLLAIAVFVLAVLVGGFALVRSIVRVAPRLRRLAEAVNAANALVEQCRELSERAARVRAESERLRALLQPFS